MDRDEAHNTRMCRKLFQLAGAVWGQSENKSKAGSLALEEELEDEEDMNFCFAPRTSLSGEELASRLPVPVVLELITVFSSQAVVPVSISVNVSVLQVRLAELG
jgi:hypothetical protein